MPEAPVHVDLLLTGGTVLTMDTGRRILEDGAVAVRGSEIVAVGSSAEITTACTADKVIDTTGHLVMPGLINAHTHILQTLLRGGLSQDRDVYDWMVNVLYPGLWRYSAREADIATRLYATEAIRAGTTTLVENCDNGRADELSVAAIRAMDRMGLRAMFARLFYDRMPDDLGNALDVIARRAGNVRRDGSTLLEDGKDAMAHTEDLMRRFHGTGDGRIRVWAAPALPHTTTDGALARSFELARQFDTMVTIHVAESPRDVSNGQLSSVEHLAARGGVNDRLLAAHCVWLNDRDMRLMGAAGAKVAHNPVSNLYLASGIAPVSQMIVHGVTVSIGTDDANCNESASMIQEMKFAALLQRGRQLDPSAITTEKIVEMATIDGAEAVGMGDRIGALEPGRLADLIVLDLDVPQLRPLHHVPNGLVFQAYGSEVITTIVNGRILMEDRTLTTMSEEEEAELRTEAQSASTRIATDAGLEIDRGWQTAGR